MPSLQWQSAGLWQPLLTLLALGPPTQNSTNEALIGAHPIISRTKLLWQAGMPLAIHSKELTGRPMGTKNSQGRMHDASQDPPSSLSQDLSPVLEMPLVPPSFSLIRISVSRLDQDEDLSALIEVD